MEDKLSVHAWELVGYAKVDKYLRDLLRERLKRIYRTFSKAERSLKIGKGDHLYLHKTFKKQSTLFKLAKYSKISFSKVEKRISEWCDSGREKYKVRFPVEVTPVHIRVVSHIIGDGCRWKTSSGRYIFEWSQKETRPLKRLQELILKTKLHTKRRSLVIRKFIIKVVCSILKIDTEKFSRVEFLRKCLLLPKEFRIQVLTAIIEDEGTVDTSKIIIRMKDKKIIQYIAKLIDSLDYSRSDIKSYTDETSFGKPKTYRIKMYKIYLLADGIKHYFKDLEKAKYKFGKLLGLWTKDKKLLISAKRTTRIAGRLRDKKLTSIILSKMQEGKTFTPKDLKKDLELKGREIDSLIRYMLSKHYIKKIKYGLYQLIHKLKHF